MVTNLLEEYLNRPECSKLTSHHKAVIRRYARMHWDVPIGRTLAMALTHLNARYSGFELVPQKFINWLYYY